MAFWGDSYHFGLFSARNLLCRPVCLRGAILPLRREPSLGYVLGPLAGLVIIPNRIDCRPMTIANLRLLTEAADRLNSWIVPLVAQAAAEAQPAAPAAQAPGSLLEFLASPMNLILISAILFMFLVEPPEKKASAAGKSTSRIKKERSRRDA